MFSKSKETTTSKPELKKPANSTPSLISADVHLQGTLSSQGEVQLDGTIKGDLKAHTILIGGTGVVEGSVEAQDIVVKGKVTGSIKANKVAIESSAKVHGDVFHDTLSIASGAQMEGQIKQLRQQQSAADPASAKPATDPKKA